jgi:hypothetical protein
MNGCVDWPANHDSGVRLSSFGDNAERRNLTSLSHLGQPILAADVRGWTQVTI